MGVSVRSPHIGKRQMGGKTYREILVECALRNRFRKLDWCGLCPFPLRKMTGRGQMENGRGGGKYHGGGSKTVCVEGFCGVFPSPEFVHPPFAAL